VHWTGVVRDVVVTEDIVQAKGQIRRIEMNRDVNQGRFILMRLVDI
jgi:hypothetical protein